MPRRRTESAGLPKLGWAGCYFYPSRSSGKGFRLVVVCPDTGRRRELSLKGRTVESAYQEADEIAFKYHRGLYDPWKVEEEAPRLSALVSRYLAEQVAWEGETRYRAERVLSRFAASLPPHYTASDVKESDVRRFAFHRGIKASTQRNYFAHVKRLFRYAMQRGLVNADPCALVVPPRAAPPSVRPLTREEYEALLEGTSQAAASGLLRPRSAERLLLALRLGVGAGLRRSELCALRWEDVDEARGVLTVRPYATVWQGRTIRFRTKTGRSRTIPLFGSLPDVLRAARDKASTPFVLCPQRSRPVAPERITKQFAAVRDALGLEAGATIHSVRHTFVSWLLAAGVPPIRIRAYTGHASLRAFEAYAHYLPTGEHEKENAALP